MGFYRIIDHVIEKQMYSCIEEERYAIRKMAGLRE